MMIENDIFNQVILEQELNALDIQEKDYYRMDNIMTSIVDKWDDIEDKVAKCYPYLYKHNFNLSGMITAFLDSLPPIDSKEVSYDISYEYLTNLAACISNFATDICYIYDNYYRKKEEEEKSNE